LTGLQRLLQAAEPGFAWRDRLPVTTVGYWIHNQLLQFPGVLVGGTAAASYLDIDTAAFLDPETRKVFESAKYAGPFSDVADYWWLAGLDAACAALMEPADETLLTGRQAVERVRKCSVPKARCIKGHEGAGYYCLITKQPVCAEHSVRPGTWLPIGADRSRIETSKYDELSAWPS
jgi:hypothetical protein